MPTVKCPRCGTLVEHAAGFQPVCPACGYGAQTTAAPPLSTPPYGAPGAPPAAYGNPPPSQGLAIVALILNIVIWPGLGSLIAGRQEGWAQGFLFLLGLILTITILFLFVGIPLMVGMWIWSIVTGADLIKKASPAPPAYAPA